MDTVTRINRILSSAIAITVALAAFAARPVIAQTPTTFSACYVPSVGAIYMIKSAGLPTACLSTAHTEITWSSGGGGAGTITGVTAGAGLTGGGTTGAVTVAVAFGTDGTAA